MKQLTDIPGWPVDANGNDWSDGIDAALEDDDGDTLYLFRGPAYLGISKSQQAVVVDPSSLTDWTGWPTRWLDGVDGADNPGDGRSYFFRDREVLVWDNNKQLFLKGYPKELPDAPKLGTKVWPPLGATKPAATTPGSPTGGALLTFAGLAASALGGVLDAGASLDGENMLIFKDDQFGIYSTTRDSFTLVGDVKTLPGWPKDWKRVDAAATWDDRTMVLFSGGSFIQYNTKTRSFRGGADLIANIPNFPAGWTDGIDAAVNLDEDTLYLFRGNSYVTLSKVTGAVVTNPQSAKDWKNWPTQWTNGPTGALEAAGQHVYFLRGSEYLPYDPSQQTFVAGFPQQIPGTSKGTLVAAWPPKTAPPAASASAGGGDSGGSGDSIVQSRGQLRVTSIIPLDTDEKMSGVDATALSVRTNKRVIPLAVSDPAHFALNISSGPAADAAGTDPNSKAGIVYYDDYPVNNTPEWGLGWVKGGADYLGAGYDPLTLDPVNYGDVSLRAPFQALKLSISNRRNLDGSLSAYCAAYSPGNSGEASTKNTLVTTLDQYQGHYGIDGSVSVGVPVVNATVKGGFSRFNTAKTGRDDMYMLRLATVSLYRYRMDLTCTDSVSGDHYRQKLDLDFRSRVLAPLFTSKPSRTDVQNWLKDPVANVASLKAWRAALDPAIRDPYLQLLKDYGHWIATSVTLGGQFRSSLTITKTMYEQSQSTEKTFETDVTAEIGAVSMGAGLAMKDGTFVQAEKGKEETASQNETSGGILNDDLNQWAATVDEAHSVPIKAQFQPLSNLLTNAFFPGVTDIDDRSFVLNALIVVHMVADADPILVSDRSRFYDEPAIGYKITLLTVVTTGAEQIYSFTLNFGTLNDKLIPFTLTNNSGEEINHQFGAYSKLLTPKNPVAIPDDPDYLYPFYMKDKKWHTAKLHFWGTINSQSSKPFDSGSRWATLSSDTPTALDANDFNLNSLAVGDGGSVQTIVFNRDSGETLTITYKVERIQ